MKRILAAVLFLLLLPALSGCATEPGQDTVLRTCTVNAIQTWSPHGWKTAEEGAVSALLTAPLCQIVPKDTETGEYQWIFVAATEILDVTGAHPEDLTRYGCRQDPEQAATEGYVYEIRLRPEMKWEDGAPIRADTYLYSMQALLETGEENPRAAAFRTGPAALAQGTGGETGLYAVDEYTLRYVCQTQCSRYDLLSALSQSWLVNPTLHESTGQAYATGKESTLSCGPYRLESHGDGRTVLVRNGQYWEYREAADGSLTSTSFFEVDGSRRSQYQIQTITIDTMTQEAAKQAFLAGELDLWQPEEEDALAFAGSTGLYRKDQTFTLRLFFHTDPEGLAALDKNGGAQNAQVLTSAAFRKAISLAIDRTDWVSATAGYRPAVTLLNGLYYCDVQEDPASIFRNSDAAMTALCQLYGIPVDSGTDLKQASSAITGYDPQQAKALMQEACRELTEAGIYTPGQEIRIPVAWKSSALNDTDRQQLALLNGYLNEAMEGSGFGTLTLEAVGSLEDRYTAVAQGDYAIGLGAWGGQVFRPYSMLRLYCDPAYADPIHESGCWDPAKETLTLSVEGEDVTMTWQAWSVSLAEGGLYADASQEVKQHLLSQLERLLLEKYYTVPLASTAECTLLSEQFRYYTENYHVLYGFGGLRLMTCREPETQ